MVQHTMVHHTMLRHTITQHPGVCCVATTSVSALQRVQLYQSEVADFDEEKIGEEDILRLQIPVQHAVRVKEACSAAVATCSLL